MVRLLVLGSVVWLTGCDVVFRLDHVSDAAPGAGATCGGTPRQQVVMNEGGANTIAVPVTATEAGNTLVLAIAISTNAFDVASLVDDGGNTWTRAVTARTPTSSPSLLDIWYVTGASPMTTFTATLEQAMSRGMAVSFTEWRCAVPLTFDAAISQAGAVAATDAPTGEITASRDALVLGAVVFSNASTVATPMLPDGFTELPAFSTGSGVGGRAAYAWAPAGAYQLDWTLDSAQAAVGGIVALRTP